MRHLSPMLAASSRSLRHTQYLRMRSLHQTPFLAQQQQQQRSDPRAHGNFYKSHGRALVKALTLAFFSYQVFYWTWIMLETEQIKDEKGYEIKALESEVRLLEEGRKSHRSAEETRSTQTEGDTARLSNQARKT